jgi:hypothetical protein
VGKRFWTVEVKRNSSGTNINVHLGAGYTSDLVRAICCKSQVRLAVSAILCPTRITFYLLLQQIADAIWCAIQCLFCSCAEIVHAANRMHQIATRYRMLRVNGSNFVSDTKSQIHQIASAICSKSHALNPSCNQPLTGKSLEKQ